MIADTKGETTALATDWSTSLTQTFSNISLTPVSSVDGKNFYYMSEGTTDNSGVAQSGAKFSSATATEATAAETTTTAYVLDYVFQLKATNTTGTEQKVAITDLNLTSPLSATNGSEKAFRVATFVENQSTTGNAFTGSIPSSAGSIYAPSGYAYQSGTTAKAISTVDASSSATLGEVTIADSANSIGTITAATTGPVYYKVWVRLWLEGEDKSCYNDLFLSSGDWSLNLKVEMGDSTGASAITGVSALDVSYTAAYMMFIHLSLCFIHQNALHSRLNVKAFMVIYLLLEP